MLNDDGIESKHTCHALPSLQLIIHNQHLNTPLPLVRKRRPPEQNRLSNVRLATTQGKHFPTLKKKRLDSPEIINISLVLFGGITHNHKYLLI